MLEFDGKPYELKYSQKRLEMIEKATGTPIMAEMVNNNGMLSISALKTYIAYGLKEEGASAFVMPKEGMEKAEALLDSNGYAAVIGVVLEALQRDCPFLFLEG